MSIRLLRRWEKATLRIKTRVLHLRRAEDVKINSSNDKCSLLSNNTLPRSVLSGKAEKFYKDPLNQRRLIYKDNNSKIGIYAWYNNINGKVYVGSGDPLYTRLSDYYQKWYLESKSNLYIVRALSKYGMVNFSLFILEYSSSGNLLECEQK
jgi:hypothetical protein